MIWDRVRTSAFSNISDNKYKDLKNVILIFQLYLY